MCGIAGIVDYQGRPVERQLLERMCAAMCHRGPDDEGYYLQGPIGLGHRRLSIIDLSGGRQPLGNEDGSIWITFNGEIYNFQELRRELEAAGHRFSTASDTEAIIHGYEEWGEGCLKRLRGMFAFALWDERARRLLLARDRLGKKPLVYAEAEGRLLFASEFQALLQDPAVRREVDLEAIDQYLTYGYVPAPRTALKGIHKLLPAHYLVWQGGELRTERYWALQYTPKLQLREEEACERLLELLSEAVRLRMISDVPLGAFLSGGIDSSAVVALMSKLSDRPVKTFSIGFEEQEFSELDHARRVAERFGTDHHELIVRPNALEVLPGLVRHYGEPYADSSAIPTFYVSQATHQYVKVALNGDGGDEDFAGYERYLGNRIAEGYRRLPGLVRRGVVEPLATLLPDSLDSRNRWRQARRFLQVAAQPIERRYLRWMTTLREEQKAEIYSQDFRRELAQSDAGSWMKQLFSQVDGLDGLDAVLCVDVLSYLPYDLLVKVDIASMANSLEARSPFLDHRVMEFAARLPSHYKLRGRTLKYLLKRSLKGLLPRENLYRRKMGFGVPVGRWFRGELKELLRDTVLSERALSRGYFAPGPVRCLVEDHIDGRQDYSYQLWALLMLELWHREFID